YHHGNLKESLVQTAIQMIEERREAAFTIRELAAAVGVSHAAAYRHFRSKRELLAEIAGEGFVGLQTEFDASLERNAGENCRTRIKGLGDAYIRYALEHPGHYRAMFHAEFHDADDFPAKKEAAERTFDSLLNLVREGISRGELVNRPPAPLATAIWSAVHGMSLLFLDGHIHSPPGPREIIDLLLERLDAGLALRPQGSVD
ncbi:MAG TPA: TetR/AcrR family transcriptional regulator, partial [Chthoniobacterales bacterium]